MSKKWRKEVERTYRVGVMKMEEYKQEGGRGRNTLDEERCSMGIRYIHS